MVHVSCRDLRTPCETYVHSFWRYPSEWCRENILPSDLCSILSFLFYLQGISHSFEKTHGECQRKVSKREEIKNWKLRMLAINIEWICTFLLVINIWLSESGSHSAAQVGVRLTAILPWPYLRLGLQAGDTRWGLITIIKKNTSLTILMKTQLLNYFLNPCS